MARSRARRPSTRAERCRGTPCRPRATSRNPCPSRSHAFARDRRADDRDDRGAPRRSTDGARWPPRAPRGTPARGTRRRSRSGRDRDGGRRRRSHRTRRTGLAEGFPASPASAPTSVATNLASLSPTSETSTPRRSPLSTGRLGCDRAFRLLCAARNRAFYAALTPRGHFSAGRTSTRASEIRGSRLPLTTVAGE